MPIDATEPYDDQNVFAKILRGEIPSRKVYEDEWALAFHDIAPKAPVHILVIPKGAYVSMVDFGTNASEAEIAGLFRAVAKVAEQEGVSGTGYRILANVGAHGHQEVPHLHIHLFGVNVALKIIVKHHITGIFTHMGNLRGLAVFIKHQAGKHC